MAIFDLFSKRQKRLRGEINDVYTYDKIPDKLRVQIVHILRDAIGQRSYSTQDVATETYNNIFATLCREYGKFSLGENHLTKEEQLFDFFLKSNNKEEVLDVIELSFKYIDKIIRDNFQQYVLYAKIKIRPENAIEELNERFKENSVGYSFTGGELIRIDSTYTHAEITKPTISLLSNNKFEGANEEYLKAHEHYRHGRNKECLAECLKSFESVIKIICKEKSWSYNETDPSSKLIQICLQNNLVPAFTQNQFTSLRNLLESGIPTIRNKLGGHGQGQVPQKVDDEITRYALNLTGSNIIFLIEQSGL